MDTEHTEGIGTSLESVQSLSLLKQAQKKRQTRQRTFFLDVPSWDGDLICEYQVVDPDMLKKVAAGAIRRARNGSEQEAAANDVDLILAAAVGLYAKDPETGERVAIEDEHGHVGYGRIAKLLGKDDEVKSQAQAVRYLMAERDDDSEDGGWVENVMAMSLHADAISRWMKDPSKHGVDLETLLGELSATRD
jgi:hypothetical protein